MAETAERWEYRIEHIECQPAAPLSVDEIIRLRREEPDVVYERMRERDQTAEACLLETLNDLGAQGWEAFELLRSDEWIRPSERQTKVV
jgi:hypothetical protein